MNIEEKVEWLERELKEIKKEIQKEENKNNGVWKPKAHEMCYSIDDAGNICEWYWLDSREDDEASLAIGNVFRTREEAEFELERLKVIQELKQFSRPFKRGKKNYNIYYSSGDGELDISTHINALHADIYFETEEKAWDAIDVVGVDRIKKYYLEIPERE